MGLGSDYVSEMEAEYGALEYHIENEARQGVWTTKEGKRIPIRQMSTRHLENTIRMLERNNSGDIYFPWICRMQEELDRRMREIETVLVDTDSAAVVREVRLYDLTDECIEKIADAVAKRLRRDN